MAKKDQAFFYLLLLATTYVTIILLPVILAYRPVQFGIILIPGGAIIFPISYALSDIVAEIYGYKIARHLFWCGISCEYLYVFLALIVINLPAPDFWKQSQSYIDVLDHSFRYVSAATVGNIIAGLLNIYLITKWKILVRGRYFWLRSLGATLTAETILTIFVYTFTFWGLTSSPHMINLMVFGFLYKLAFSVLLTFPASIIVAFLKAVSEVDIFLYENNNPFKYNLYKYKQSGSNYEVW